MHFYPKLWVTMKDFERIKGPQHTHTHLKKNNSKTIMSKNCQKHNAVFITFDSVADSFPLIIVGYFFH